MRATLLDDQIEDRIQTGSNKAEVAHIVMVPPGEPDESPQAYVMRARVEGFPITALCGYVWIPNKMAKGLPVCEECKAIYENDPFANDPDDRNRLPDE